MPSPTPPDFNFVFESLPSAALVLDSESQVIAATAEYLRRARLERDRVLGRNVLEVLSELPNGAEHVDAVRASIARVREKLAPDSIEIAPPEFDTAVEDECCKPWEITHWPMLDREGRLVHLLHRLDDAAARMSDAEVALRRHAKELEEANSRLLSMQRQLEIENRRADSATRWKSEFLTSVSHELRTPLNAILGFAELLKDGPSAVTLPQQREFLTHIGESGRQLLQLINDVLDLSKVETGGMEILPTEVELPKLIAEVLTVVRSVSASRRVKIRVAECEVERACIDAPRVKQVLYHFLSNALKFTPAGGTATVAVCADGADFFRLEVSDTGIGIASDDLPRLIAGFGQVEGGLSRAYSGVGLGLSLVRRIVEAHGGTIGATSTLGQGSTFFARLPRTLDAISVPAPEVPGDPDGKPRILVVEDNFQERTLIGDALLSAGYSPHFASSAEAAISLAERVPFDAITLDLMLGASSGLDVLRSIRRGGPNAATPVIVVSVMSDRNAISAFQATDVLRKPLEPESLLSALGRAGVDTKSGAILVVDDDPAARALMQAALERLGYTAACFAQAEAALEAFPRISARAVIVDLSMPRMNGVMFLERLQELPAGRTVPAIVWTATDIGPSDRAKLNRMAAGVLPKPAHGGAVGLLDGLSEALRSLQLR